MPRVADYAIITDAFVLEFHQHIIDFTVPANIDPGSRCVLGFMVKAEHVDDMTLTIHINDAEVVEQRFSGGFETFRFFQEVVAAGVVKPGSNQFIFHTTTTDAAAVQISDAVLWFQANI
ncbi:MAG TPA: hypothetical protein VL346_10580 [Acidobacteriaceae bacterium]|nr:hypothetical protein [Acidobacteriaceae bacterium]